MQTKIKKYEALDDIIDKKFLDLFSRHHKCLSEVERRLWSAGSSRELGDSKLVPQSNSSEKLFEIRVENIQLSSLAVKYLNSRFKKCSGIRVCWNFLNFESSTPLVQAREGNTIVRYSKKYKIIPDVHFANYIMKRILFFDLYGVYGPENKHVGRGEIDAKNILANYECTTTIDVLSVDKMKLFIKSRNPNTICAKVVFIFKWMSDIIKEITVGSNDFKEVKRLFFRNAVTSGISIALSTPKDRFQRRGESNETLTSTTGSSKQDSLDDLDYLYIRSVLESIVDRALSVPKYFSKSMKDAMATDGRIKWSRALEEHAILSRRNCPTTIFDSTVIIDVLSLKFDKDVLNGMNGLKMFYIEYAFLSEYGREMKSESISISNSDVVLEFNFRKAFQIDMQYNYKNCKLLATFIKHKKSIQFFVNEERDKFQVCCKEIGFCKVNLFDLIQGQENSEIDDYPTRDIEKPYKKIGMLKIGFSGIQAMRRVALKILSPKDFVLQ